MPDFDGDYKAFPGWWAAFTASVDKDRSPVNIKLLRLREVLKGEAGKILDALEHSPSAYYTAMERLEKKYGGDRRQITLRLQEVNKMKNLNEDNAVEVEQFAEMITALTSNMKTGRQRAELGDGTLYMTLQQKMSEKMITRFNRWLVAEDREESVIALRDFVETEAEHMVKAMELKTGVGKGRSKRQTEAKTHTGVAENKENKGKKKNVYKGKKKFQPKCRLCDGDHGLWACPDFEALDIDSKWDKAKEVGVCYRCLNINHTGNNCTMAKTCNIDGCQWKHHRLLHNPRATTRKREPVKPEEAPVKSKADTAVTVVKKIVEESLFVSMVGARRTALRTLPIILMHDNQRLQVNAMLDDGSSQSYITEEVADQLKLDGPRVEMEVTTLSGRTYTFYGREVDVEVQSLDRRFRSKIQLVTMEDITGQMRPVEWHLHKEGWAYLASIPFGKIGTRKLIDVLLGCDVAHLHVSLEEVLGKIGEPIARRTPLGWTCIGGVSPRETSSAVTHFVSETSERQLMNTVQKFWEVEDPPMNVVLTKEEDELMKQTRNSLTWTGERYEVRLPWDEELKKKLMNNFPMALSRLESIERKLKRNPQLAEQYEKTFLNYESKGYIVEVFPKDIKTELSIYIPHFPVIKEDRSTTKVRTVFDAAAKF